MDDLYYETKKQPLYKIKDIYPKVSKLINDNRKKRVEFLRKKAKKVNKFSYPITYALTKVLNQKIHPVRRKDRSYRLSLLMPNGDFPKSIFLPNNPDEWENWSLKKLNELKQKGLI